MVRRAGIRNRQLAAGIHIAEKNVGNGLPALIAGVIGHHDRSGRIRDSADNARASFGEHQDDGFFRFHDFPSEIELRVG